MDLLQYCNDVLSSLYGIEAKDLGMDEAIAEGRLQSLSDIDEEIRRLADNLDRLADWK